MSFINKDIIRLIFYIVAFVMIGFEMVSINNITLDMANIELYENNPDELILDYNYYNTEVNYQDTIANSIREISFKLINIMLILFVVSLVVIGKNE